MSKLGLVIVGVNGAVATTLIAGVAVMARGIVPRIGMVTERTDARIAESLDTLLDFAPPQDLVFGGCGRPLRERLRGCAESPRAHGCAPISLDRSDCGHPSPGPRAVPVEPRRASGR
jgi:hypothetical protein